MAQLLQAAEGNIFSNQTQSQAAEASVSELGCRELGGMWWWGDRIPTAGAKGEAHKALYTIMATENLCGYFKPTKVLLGHLKYFKTADYPISTNQGQAKGEERGIRETVALLPHFLCYFLIQVRCILKTGRSQRNPQPVRRLARDQRQRLLIYTSGKEFMYDNTCNRTLYNGEV